MPEQHSVLEKESVTRLAEETYGAWGRMTLAECDDWMQQRRQEDWGDEERMV
ncbi:MAG: hypothetical protein H7834_02030 [Magnetococcus sp. YQC-9]